MTTATQAFKAMLADFPADFTGAPKSPVWETILTNAVAELINRVEALEAERPKYGNPAEEHE